MGSRTIAPHTFFSVIFWWLYVVLRSGSTGCLFSLFPFWILCDKFLIGIVFRYTILHRICWLGVVVMIFCFVIVLDIDSLGRVVITVVCTLNLILIIIKKRRILYLYLLCLSSQLLYYNKQNNIEKYKALHKNK
jgi:hypothetical protein